MRLAVCFGGTYDMYLKHARIINFLGKKFTKKKKESG